MRTYKSRTILPLQNMLLCECEHSVKVTRIGDGWNIRVFTNQKLNQEARVYDRMDIRKEIHSMLRMEDKCGNISQMASRSRDRYYEKSN